MSMRNSTFLQPLNDPLNVCETLCTMLAQKVPSYFLCLASTSTSDVEGISAAGATPAQRRLTPSVDADILRSSATRPGEQIPVSPDGIVSPVVIARACLEALSQKAFVVDCGCFRAPLMTDLIVGQTPAQCVSSGHALALEQVEKLFEQGRNFGKVAEISDYALISECVPGGTTTAAAVLQGFSINCLDYVSTSVTNPDKSKRRNLIESGIKNAFYDVGQWTENPLKAIASVGDPMQAYAAGMAISALARCPVVLGGGSQMLAVYHLVKRIVASRGIDLDLSQLFVITTKWVAGDPSGNTVALSKLVDASFFASFPEFTLSKFAGLRAYENWHVKEGLGAGALMAAAQARTQLTNAQLVQMVDSAYAALNLQKI